MSGLPDSRISQQSSIHPGEAVQQRAEQQVGQTGGRQYKTNYLARAGLALLTLISLPISLPVLLCSSNARAKFAEIWKGKRIEQLAGNKLSPSAAHTNRLMHQGPQLPKTIIFDDFRRIIYQLQNAVDSETGVHAGTLPDLQKPELTDLINFLKDAPDIAQALQDLHSKLEKTPEKEVSNFPEEYAQLLTLLNDPDPNKSAENAMKCKQDLENILALRKHYGRKK